MKTKTESVASGVAEAFADGRLYLIVDAFAPLNNHGSMFEGEREVFARAGIDTNHPSTWPTGRFVHVMSRPAGGEIRGYVHVEGEDRLRLRQPCYSGDWPELDAEVAARVLAKARAD